MSNKIAVIKLNKDTVSWYDPINSIYLSEFKDKKADVYDDMDFEPIRNGIKYNYIKIIEGEIPDEECNIEHDLTSFYNKKEIDEKVNTFNEQFNTITNNTIELDSTNFGSSDECCVSFVTDDGQMTDYSIFFKQIFEQEGVPANTCIITNNIGSTKDWMSKNQIDELKKSGWTVASHSATHINIEGKTEKEIFDDLLQSKKILSDYNFDHDFYISPFGGYNPIVDKVCRKLFRCHFTTGYRFTDGASDIQGTGKTGIFDNYKIYRRNGIGETASGYEVTKENMIEDIEYAKENKLWLVFCMHSHYEKFKTGNGVAELREVIQYCKNNNIPIVNLREGFKLKANKVDLGNRNVSSNWLRIDCNGNEFKANNITKNTDTTHASHFINLVNIKCEKKNIDFGIKFDYHISNISGDDGNTTTGSVTAIFRNANGKMLETLFYNDISTVSTSTPVEFVAKQIQFTSTKNIVEIYAKINKNYSTLTMFNINEVFEDKNNSYLEVKNNEDFTESLQYDFTAKKIGKTYLTSKKPDFRSNFKGQIVVDTNNKDVYVSHDEGYNKWIVLTGEQSTFTPVIKGKTNAGQPTYEIQEGKYIKFGKMVYFTIKLVGVFDGSQTGSMVIDGLPFSANGSYSVNIGYQYGFSSNSLRYAYISSTKEIFLNKISSNGGTVDIIGSECSTNFNIWLSGNYITW